MPAARALSSPSGEAAEDNVVEREKFGVGRNYGLRVTGNGWTDRRGIWNSILDVKGKRGEYSIVGVYVCFLMLGRIFDFHQPKLEQGLADHLQLKTKLYNRFVLYEVKWLLFKWVFGYVKVLPHSCLPNTFEPLMKLLKWGAVWRSTTRGIRITSQSQKYQKKASSIK